MRVYQRSGSWYIDFSHDGVRTRKKIGSKKDAENALSAIKVDILRGEYRFQKSVKKKFDKFADEYLEYAKANKRSWSREEIILNHLKSHFSEKLLSKINAKDIENYKQERLEKVKPPTINRELAQLKFMYNLAKKWKYVDENPVKDVKFFQERQLATRTLSEKEARELIDKASGNLKPLIIIGLNTGMRRGELFNLRWNDIDFNMHFIYIKETKTGVTRKIPMSPLVEKTLRGVDRKFEFIFQSPKTRKKLKDIRTSWRSACERAGIQDLRFHDLRHTAATWMVAKGIDLVTVKEILGHANIKTTMRYAHPTPENKLRAVNVLAAILGEKDGTEMAQPEVSQVTKSLISSN